MKDKTNKFKNNSNNFAYEKWFNDQVNHYPKAREDVLHFIGKIVTSGGESDTKARERMFSAGYCYYFALMLKSNFGGSVVWHYNHSHILWMDDNGIAYEIYGVFDDYEEYDLVPVELLGEKGLNGFLHLSDEYKLTDEDNAEISERVEEWKKKQIILNSKNLDSDCDIDGYIDIDSTIYKVNSVLNNTYGPQSSKSVLHVSDLELIKESLEKYKSLIETGKTKVFA